ncbi:MAG: T9SS C-terminal target domain-containing protein [Cytophagales bacterium]|nr:MAG: T9SS C-terminal target domain-containing protein [Cytophagales bacterium]
MKKLLLVGLTMISAITFAQDFSSYCSVNDFTEGKVGQFNIENKAFTSLSVVGGELIATKKDTLGEAEIKFNVPEFWEGGKVVNSGVFRFKVKSSYTALVRIKVVSDGFSKTYDIPFSANKNIIGGNEYVDYVLDVTGVSFNPLKFQEVIIVVNNASSVAGTVSIKDFNYGGVECGTFAANSTLKASSKLYSSKAYPNPANEQINVVAELKEIGKVKINLINTLGNVVYTITQNTSSFNHQINSSAFPKGAYQLVYSLNDIMIKSELVVIQ